MTTHEQAAATGSPLEVDRFPSSMIIEPRNPVTYEMTLTPGPTDRELYVIGFEYELAGHRDPSGYVSKPPRTPSQSHDAPTGEADLSSDLPPLTASIA